MLTKAIALVYGSKSSHPATMAINDDSRFACSFIPSTPEKGSQLNANNLAFNETEALRRSKYTSFLTQDRGRIASDLNPLQKKGHSEQRYPLSKVSLPRVT